MNNEVIVKKLNEVMIQSQFKLNKKKCNLNLNNHSIMKKRGIDF